MFAIHAPQTVELTTDQDGEDLPGRINFAYAGADTSRCKMEIMSKGRVWTFIFNQRGYLVSQTFENADGAEGKTDPNAKPLTDADYIVNGVDTRSFNPYTHVAPVDADTLARDGQTPGGKQPGGDSKEARAERTKAIEAAHGDAQKAIDEQRKRMDEKPEETVARERKERDEKLKQVSDQLAKDNRASAQAVPAYDPLVPPPSSPLPGSSAPKPQSQPDHGVVNTTQTAANRQYGAKDSQGRSSDDPNYDPFK